MVSARFLAKAGTLLHVRSRLVRECLAESLAVFVQMLITLGAAAQTITSQGAKGGYVSSCLAGAVAVMVAIYIAGGVSGAHLNPAFSLAMCVLARCPWWKLPIFTVVQTLAAFLGAGAVYALYYDAIQHYSNGTLAVTGPWETASIFATYPAPYLSLQSGFLDQVMGTALLLVGILAIVDTQNKGIPKGLEPVAVAMLVLALSLSVGSNCSCAINPARDFGPRLFTYVAGWGPQVFRWVTRAGHGWWWVPVVAPLVGAVVGSMLYQVLVAFHHSPAPGSAHELEVEKQKEIPIFIISPQAEEQLKKATVLEEPWPVTSLPGPSTDREGSSPRHAM
ncbi:aquaporin-10 [Alligator mississippiensis]|uniref:aquaporin-10 n=1 Tax=Alligator mississippiensis TaxID=8496 RepID=UPI000907357D|nr:aquaporin-10 [Alligator mississippiensis]